MSSDVEVADNLFSLFTRAGKTAAILGLERGNRRPWRNEAIFIYHVPKGLFHQKA